MAHPGEAPIDRYVVLEHLSEGGMGAIYVGKKLGAGGFEMAVVLKQLLPEFTQQEEFIDLFLREAKLSATLDHANIIHTIDLVTAGGEYFIVMEYLPGADLRTLLRKAKRRGSRFSPRAAIFITREVLSALSYAHAKRDLDGNPLRLIHRDVSPSNVLLSYDGEVKLTDFGIAKAATHTSLFYKVKGKVGYMSPEQAKSETLDHRSDLYSIAVCMYETLTGERLFVHAGLTTSAEEIYSQPVPPVSRKAPGVPRELDAIMAKALALDPDQRYQTAGEFQEALMRLAHRAGLLVSAPELAAELHESCGPIEQWRDEDEEDVAPAPGGTVVYAGEDEDEDEDEDEEPVEAPLHLQSPPPAQLARPRAELGKLAGVELTSIINMIDLETQNADLDSGPRRYARASPSQPPLFESEPPLRAPPPPHARAPLPPPARTRTESVAPPPPAPLPPPQRAPQPIAPRAAPPPRRLDERELGRRHSEPRRGPPWVVIVAILVLAGIAAFAIAISGPSVPGR